MNEIYCEPYEQEMSKTGDDSIFAYRRECVIDLTPATLTVHYSAAHLEQIVIVC